MENNIVYVGKNITTICSDGTEDEALNWLNSETLQITETTRYKKIDAGKVLCQCSKGKHHYTFGIYFCGDK